MITAIIVMALVIIALLARCWYMELVCEQLRSVNEGKTERMDDALARAAHAERYMKRYFRFPDHGDGSGI